MGTAYKSGATDCKSRKTKQEDMRVQLMSQWIRKWIANHDGRQKTPEEKIQQSGHSIWMVFCVGQRGTFSSETCQQQEHPTGEGRWLRLLCRSRSSQGANMKVLCTLPCPSCATVRPDSCMPHSPSFTWTERSLDFSLWYPRLFSLFQFEDHLWLGNLIPCSWVNTQDLVVCASGQRPLLQVSTSPWSSGTLKGKKRCNLRSHATKWPTSGSAKERTLPKEQAQGTIKLSPKEKKKL